MDFSAHQLSSEERRKLMASARGKIAAKHAALTFGIQGGIDAGNASNSNSTAEYYTISQCDRALWEQITADSADSSDPTKRAYALDALNYAVLTMVPSLDNQAMKQYWDTESTQIWVDTAGVGLKLNFVPLGDTTSHGRANTYKYGDNHAYMTLERASYDYTTGDYYNEARGAITDIGCSKQTQCNPSGDTVAVRMKTGWVGLSVATPGSGAPCTQFFSMLGDCAAMGLELNIQSAFQISDGEYDNCEEYMEGVWDPDNTGQQPTSNGRYEAWDEIHQIRSGNIPVSPGQILRACAVDRYAQESGPPTCADDINDQTMDNGRCVDLDENGNFIRDFRFTKYTFMPSLDQEPITDTWDVHELCCIIDLLKDTAYYATYDVDCSAAGGPIGGGDDCGPGTDPGGGPIDPGPGPDPTDPGGPLEPPPICDPLAEDCPGEFPDPGEPPPMPGCPPDNPLCGMPDCINDPTAVGCPGVPGFPGCPPEDPFCTGTGYPGCPPEDPLCNTPDFEEPQMPCLPGMDPEEDDCIGNGIEFPPFEPPELPPFEPPQFPGTCDHGLCCFRMPPGDTTFRNASGPSGLSTSLTPGTSATVSMGDDTSLSGRVTRVTETRSGEQEICVGNPIDPNRPTNEPLCFGREGDPELVTDAIQHVLSRMGFRGQVIFDSDCTATIDACWPAGTPLIYILNQLLRICGFCTFRQPDGNIIVGFCTPLNVHWHYHESIDITGMETDYNSQQDYYYVEVCTPDHIGQSGQLISSGWCQRVATGSPTATDPDSVKSIEVPRNITPAQGLLIAQNWARYYRQVNVPLIAFSVPMNIQLRERHQLHMHRPSLGWIGVYMITRLKREYTKEGWFSTGLARWLRQE